MWGIASVHVGDSTSTAEAVQYCGSCSVLRRVAAVHVGDSVSTVEAIQYCGGIAAVLRRDSCSTAEDSISTCGG